MNNTIQNEIPRETLSKYNLTDEYIFRELAEKMVRDMPYDELQKLLNLTKIDPYSDVSRSILSNPDAPDSVKRHIRFLKGKDVVLFEATCTL